MSDYHHGASKIRASHHEGGGGGAGKWLLGAVGAAVLIGGGYFAYQTYGPAPNQDEVAYNDPYAEDDALRAGPAYLDDGVAEDGAPEDEATPSTAQPAPAEPRRTASSRSTASAASTVTPEETIGITPVNAVVASEDNDIVVTAARRPTWARTPSARRLSAMYPATDLDRGREGEARLHCIVQDGGALDCERASETSRSFGTAALRVARSYRHATQLADGSSAVGSPVNMRVVFRIEEDETGRRFASR